jgi:hypothetical protein
LLRWSEAAITIALDYSRLPFIMEEIVVGSASGVCFGVSGPFDPKKVALANGTSRRTVGALPVPLGVGLN